MMSVSSGAKLLFISSTPYSEYSGGGSGISHHCFRALQSLVPAEYCFVPLPPPVAAEALFSKTAKLLHLPRRYFAYSEKRLARIAETAEEKIGRSSAELLFFAGFTPWCGISPDRPYAAYNDIPFATYVEIYNRKKEFSPHDLRRIMDREREFLDKAQCVFFRSRWGLEEARKAYRLSGGNFIAVGRGGAALAPDADVYAGRHLLLFIAREFLPKGGDLCCKIFVELRKRIPDLELAIVGDAPPRELLEIPGITYHGFFDKAIPAEQRQLNQLLAEAMFLVHPTSKDTNPLVISEAGYFGCPTVSVRAFAIPELIDDGRDGLLLDTPVDCGAAAARMEFYFHNGDAYHELRRNARRRHLSQCSWPRVAECMISELSKNRTDDGE